MKKNIKELQIQILNELIKHTKLVNEYNKKNDTENLIKELQIQKENNEKFINKIVNDQIKIQKELNNIINILN
jgi:hypothetical protein